MYPTSDFRTLGTTFVIFTAGQGFDQLFGTMLKEGVKLRTVERNILLF